MLKFRSMVVNSDKTGLTSTCGDARRIIGSFVRAYKIDELIQALDAVNVESRPVWNSMYLQALCFREALQGRGAEDLFRRGICLPSLGDQVTWSTRCEGRLVWGTERA